MGARKKLNSVYLIAIGIASGLLGVYLQSFVVFVISFALLAALMLHNGTIRPTKPTRR